MADNSQLEYDEEQPPSEETKVETETGTQHPPAQGSETDLPIKEGVVFGAGAYLVSYVVIAAMTMGTMAQAVTDTSELPGSLTIAAWSMLSGLGVGLEIGGEATTLGGAISAGLNVTGMSIGSTGLELLIPLVTFTAAGYGLAKYVGIEGTQDALKSAVMIVPGVLVLALATAVLATNTVGNGDEVTVSLVTSDAVLYAGIVFPAIFALIGGLLASWPDPVDQVLAKIDSQ